MSIYGYPMLISDETDGSVIVIGLEEILKKQNRPPIEPTADEKIALEIIYKALSEINIDPSEISLKKISKNYLTLIVGEFIDFCRLKIGPKSKWISLAFSPEDEQILASDLRMVNVKDKKIRHWKIPINSTEELNTYSDLIQKACLYGRTLL